MSVQENKEIARRWNEEAFPELQECRALTLASSVRSMWLDL
ncbi:MAG: hypothetical protein ACK2VD_00950 [Anaerolineae bacterium]|jgi:hypothetical protein